MDREQLTSRRVVVIGGGWSDEREISLESATEVKGALLEAGFTSVDLLDLAQKDFVGALVAGNYDVAFVALHGAYGEDGCIQGLLEILHIPYTFSGVAASAAASEKQIAKALFASAGIRAPRGVDLPAGAKLTSEQADELVEELDLPLFVKPAANGSSFGISRVTDRAALNDAIAAAGAAGGRVLVEECVEGMEITVPVIGNEDAHALPIVEIVTGAEFYDLKVKYEPSSLHHVIPARLEPGVYARAQELAVRAHKALGCRGCSRSDFIVTAAGEPVILETNTIPGMTANSLLPDSARHGGIEFPELCARFVECALGEA
ncbi:MAG TPA: D-alanine--D-alanine ligase [Candidatus Olsenella pullicola]|nr:D-alanine--D-alanine ligase [Candidatus Olsenella pullicola]